MMGKKLLVQDTASKKYRKILKKILSFCLFSLLFIFNGNHNIKESDRRANAQKIPTSPQNNTFGVDDTSTMRFCKALSFSKRKVKLKNEHESSKSPNY